MEPNSTSCNDDGDENSETPRYEAESEPSPFSSTLMKADKFQYGPHSHNSSSSSSHDFKGLRYQGRPPISEVPELLELCDELITQRNVTGLAMLARQRGLPPSLRWKIWPVLLKYHPYVQHPYIEPDFDDDDDDDEQDDIEGEEDQSKSDLGSSEMKSVDQNSSSKDQSNDETINIPIKEIEFDLHKYLRNAERYKPKKMTPEIRELFEIQDQMFKIIKSSIIKFIKKWGSIVKYSSGLTWISLGLAEWVPPVPDSPYVLCSRDDIAKNGTKLRNLRDNYFDRCDSYNQEYSNGSSTVDSTSVISGSPRSISSIGTTSLASSEDTNHTSQSKGGPFKPMTFAEIYERMVLVILHSPDPAEKEKVLSRCSTVDTVTSSHLSDTKRLDGIPRLGGTVEDRISFFFFGLRKLMPELYSYLSDEDCLKGDWILWWLKYCGSKVWSRYDRGRTWDLLLGFRADCRHFENDIRFLNSLSEEKIRLLGPDLFWYPELDDLTVNNGYHKKDGDSIPSTSFKTLINQVSVSSTDIPSLSNLSLNDHEDNTGISKLPFSVIDPHIQIVFISLAFLKSKEFTITELDQSEIIQLFNRLSSLKTSEIRSFVSAETDANQHNRPRKSNRDIENIILEAGELWRKFIYMEMMEENT